MTPYEIEEDMEKVRGEMRDLQRKLEGLIDDSVRKDHVYRLAKARAVLRADGKTVAQREANAELLASDERLEAKLADGLQRSAEEHLRGLRKELDALVSKSYLCRTEMELAR